MPAVTSAPPSGNLDIDGLLTGAKWAVSSLTYSFPTSAGFYGGSYSFDNEPGNNFEALNTVQASVVRTALAAYATVAAITFSEVTESSTVHGDLRVGESDDPSTAWGYYLAAPATQSIKMMNQGALVLDLSVKDVVIWRGVAQARVAFEADDKKREAILREGVRDLFKKYPPKK